MAGVIGVFGGPSAMRGKKRMKGMLGDKIKDVQFEDPLSSLSDRTELDKDFLSEETGLASGLSEEMRRKLRKAKRVRL